MPLAGRSRALGPIAALAVWAVAACDAPPAADEDAGVDLPDAAFDAASADLGGGDLGAVDAGGGDRATGRDTAVGRDARPVDSGPRDLGLDPVDASAPADAGNPGVELNPGWIGGACSGAGECSLDGYTSTAICETAGFSGGLCTQSCTQPGSSWVCPDHQPIAAAETMSFCIDAGGDPRCVATCHFDKSPTGCRPGYTCVLRQRYGDPSRIAAVCLPSATQAWPGESAPAFDIGAACGAPAACGHSACLDLPGGYCSKQMCDLAGCPTGSTCFHLLDVGIFACLEDCGGAGDCRSGEGYVCDPEFDVCWPGSAQEHHPLWNPGVGAGDCAAAWAAGLSPCDLVPDDYAVVHKSARNLALCDCGSLVANFSVGLSAYAPVGDKEREGDYKTPEGVFYAASKIPQGVSSYYEAYLISYPDAADAARGLQAGLIDQSQHDAIVSAQQSCAAPPQDTELGSYIEVHGGGDDTGDYDWTWGCVALDNAHIDRLWNVLDVNETIVIVP
ncbi:MAG: L,D-transpeptidase family protein [Deltaproteobacteria bacterium]|nr:L,D-transpeptidase family protein [Deltaproteobacteria bacterium]